MVSLTGFFRPLATRKIYIRPFDNVCCTLSSENETNTADLVAYFIDQSDNRISSCANLGEINWFVYRNVRTEMYNRKRCHLQFWRECSYMYANCEQGRRNWILNNHYIIYTFSYNYYLSCTCTCKHNIFIWYT